MVEVSVFLMCVLQKEKKKKLHRRKVRGGRYRKEDWKK